MPDVLPHYRASFEPRELSNEETEAVDYWVGLDPRQLFPTRLAEVLVPCKSWSEEALMFGDEEGNDAQVWNDSVYFRIDMRSPDLVLVDSLVNIARDLDCFMVFDDGRPVEPELNVFIDAMKNSPAVRFVHDPVGFLRGLG